jgi:hypothetical protein
LFRVAESAFRLPHLDGSAFCLPLMQAARRKSIPFEAVELFAGKWTVGEKIPVAAHHQRAGLGGPGI